MKQDLDKNEFSSKSDEEDYIGNDEDYNNEGNFLRGCLVSISIIAIITAIIIAICKLS